MRYSRIIYLLIWIVFAGLKGFCQQNENIRFVYSGDEYKPHGTLIICKGEKVPLNDKLLDSMFGKCILTDEFSFALVKKYILTDCIFLKKSKPRQFESKYVVVINGEIKYDLEWGKGNSGNFFRELALFLNKSKGDENVIKVLYEYY